MKLIDFSGCIKPGVISNLEGLKNKSEISKNPFGSFFQILQQQQDQQNSSMYPVLAEINSYAHVNQYGNEEDPVIRVRKMTFNNELMEPFYLNEENACGDQKEVQQIEQQMFTDFGCFAGGQQARFLQNYQNEGDHHSQSNELQQSECCNGYEEEDQEYEDCGANTPGFTSHHHNSPPQQKRNFQDIIIKTKTSCTEQNRVSNEYFTRSQLLFEESPVFSATSISPQNPPMFSKYPQRKKRFKLDDDIEEEEEEEDYSQELIPRQDCDFKARQDAENFFTAPAPILTKQFMSTQFNLNLPAFGQAASPRNIERSEGLQITSPPLRKGSFFGGNNMNSSTFAQKQPFKIFDTLIANPKGYTHKNSSEQLKEIIKTTHVNNNNNKKNQQNQNKKDTVTNLVISQQTTEGAGGASINSAFLNSAQQNQTTNQSIEVEESSKQKKKIVFNLPQESLNNNNSNGGDFGGDILLKGNDNQMQHGNQENRTHFNLRKGSFCCVENEDEADIEEEANSQINSCFQFIDSPFSKCQHESTKPSYTNLDSIPSYSLLAGQYKSIGKHLERLQKLVEKINLTKVPRKYIFNSQHTQCLERVKQCLTKSNKMNAQPFITSSLYVVQFQLLQNKFNIMKNDKQKQRQIAYRSQKAYQRAFTKLEANYQHTLDYITSFHAQDDQIKQSMASLFIDSKLMALPQGYDQLINYISNISNLTHLFYLLIQSQQGLQSNRDMPQNNNKLQRHFSTPSSIMKSTHFSQQSHSSSTTIKKSSSIQQLNNFMLLSSNQKNSSVVADSATKQSSSKRQEFKQVKSSQNNNESTINNTLHTNNKDHNNFNILNTINQQENNNYPTDQQCQYRNSFCINPIMNNTNNDNVQQLNNANHQNNNMFQYDNHQNSNEGQNQTSTNNVFPFFGGSHQQQSSRSSSVRSSHFNEDNDIYNSPISTPHNNAHIYTISNIPSSSVCNQSSFQNKYDFINQNAQDSETQSNAKEITPNNLRIYHHQSNESHEYNKFEMASKSPFITSDNEETALPTFKSQQLNQTYDYSHTPSTQYHVDKN